MVAQDLSGQTFGLLVAVRPTGEIRYGRRVWECLCVCGNKRVATAWHLKSGQCKSCGCMRAATTEKLKARMLRYRKITDGGCWEWTGHRNNSGYGKVTVQPLGSKVVHRVAAHVWLGFDLKSELYICHKCDNPPCFNPEHLFIGTAVDNVADSFNKGRRTLIGQRERDKTHCPKGHEYSEANTALTQRGWRRCKICRRAQQYKCFHARPKSPKKTHCPAGHEYSSGNTYIANGTKHCRHCRAEACRRFRAKKSQASA